MALDNEIPNDDASGARARKRKADTVARSISENLDEFRSPADEQGLSAFATQRGARAQGTALRALPRKGVRGAE